MRPEEIGSIDTGPDQVSLRELRVSMPTYPVGKPDKNPLFLEKRVYQGSSGKVYPFPVIETMGDEKVDQEWTVLVLENQWVQIWVLPELGGRVHRFLDKTNGYDVVYYNRVIKPALVSLTGPWISGGIEFNWPQHHRPSTFLPLAYQTEVSPGAAQIQLSEIDRMFGTKVLATLSLRPESSRLEIQVQLTNRTPLPQTFLWWANPAVAVHDQTQSVFPPDVHAVMDHGKRDVSAFPIARGTYYKIDYSAGVDISWYKNIPVPTSYMVHHSDYDFVGHYDHRSRAGLLHWANHHVSPGKKQWTWGTSDFGQAWERNLTDADGPYIELMTGVFTDNQPDFTWLEPSEEKRFVQYFMPVRDIGVVRNSNRDWALALEVQDGGVKVGVSVSTVSRGLRAELRQGSHVLLSRTLDLDPATPFTEVLRLPAAPDAPSLVWVLTDGERVLEARPPVPGPTPELPAPAKPVPPPSEVASTDALFWAGQHLEQYRHATCEPEDYYQEGLRRDGEDYRLNTALGVLLLRRGAFDEAAPLLERACQTARRHNPNPADGSAFYYYATLLRYQGRCPEACDLYWKATWSHAWQAQAFFELARLASLGGNTREALSLVRSSLDKQPRFPRALHLEAALRRAAGLPSTVDEALKVDPLDPGLLVERCFAALGGPAGLAREPEGPGARVLLKALGAETYPVRELCADYLACGDQEAAAELADWAWTHCHRSEADRSPDPLLVYYRAAALGSGWELTRALSPDWFFPNRLEDLVLLTRAVEARPDDGLAHYGLGNFYYDRKQTRRAVQHWEAAALYLPEFAPVRRNLALANFNKLGNQQAAMAWLDEAARRAPDDPRIAFERDQLRRKLGWSPERRWEVLADQKALWWSRDDFCVEVVTLLNTLGRTDEAFEVMTRRRFHPWEGGEGKIVRQYVVSLIHNARRHLAGGRPAVALADINAAFTYPENLGEGKLAGTRDQHLLYWRGCALDRLGRSPEARVCWEKACEGELQPAGMLYYNDQPPEMIWYQGLSAARLGRPEEADRQFLKLSDWGARHQNEPLKIDYFAVSFPEFQIFEEDLNVRHRVHCLYLMALGEEGRRQLGRTGPQGLKALVAEILRLDPNHQGVTEHWPQSVVP